MDRGSRTNGAAPQRELFESSPAQGFDELFPEKLTLDVTRADCERGLRRDDYGCAAARAVARRFDGADVRVGSGWIEVRYAGQRVTYLVPPELRRQIVAFDSGAEFSAGAYSLRRYERRAVSRAASPTLR